MAAAWPYCDAVVSAHNLEALDELLAALRSPAVRRPPVLPAAAGSTRGEAAPGAGQPGPAGAAPNAFNLPLTEPIARRWTSWR